MDPGFMSRYPGIGFPGEGFQSPMAWAFLLYMLIITVLQNTLYRVPLIDPLLAVLAGIGCTSIWERLTARRSRIIESQM
jgi:hypothetical protein